VDLRGDWTDWAQAAKPITDEVTAIGNESGFILAKPLAFSPSEATRAG
jgi:hypothetical protein